MKTLPDYLRKGMKLVIVGCNPTESSVRAGHYYAGRSNPFWPMLYESGVVPEPFDYPDDRRIIEFGIGLTDLVKRPTKTMEELKREDFAEGRIVLSQKLEEYLPTVVAFNGKMTYRAVCPAQMQLRPAERTHSTALMCSYSRPLWDRLPGQIRHSQTFSKARSIGFTRRSRRRPQPVRNKEGKRISMSSPTQSAALGFTGNPAWLPSSHWP